MKDLGSEQVGKVIVWKVQREDPLYQGAPAGDEEYFDPVTRRTLLGTKSILPSEKLTAYPEGAAVLQTFGKQGLLYVGAHWGL